MQLECTGFEIFPFSGSPCCCVLVSSRRRAVENVWRSSSVWLIQGQDSGHARQRRGADCANPAKRLGFDVTSARDLGGDALGQVFRDFIDRVGRRDRTRSLRCNFAGYGFQLEGENYLVPVDADVAEPDVRPQGSAVVRADAFARGASFEGNFRDSGCCLCNPVFPVSGGQRVSRLGRAGNQQC